MSGTSMIPGDLSSTWWDVALSWHCHSTPQRQFCAGTGTKPQQGLPCSSLSPVPQSLHGSRGVSGPEMPFWVAVCTMVVHPWARACWEECPRQGDIHTALLGNPGCSVPPSAAPERRW